MQKIDIMMATNTRSAVHCDRFKRTIIEMPTIHKLVRHALLRVCFSNKRRSPVACMAIGAINQLSSFELSFFGR
jgi:hypothetical protein